MAHAYKCDACGALFERNVYDTPDILIVRDCHPYGDKQYDLCPKCQKILEGFIHYSGSDKKEEKSDVDR